MSAALSHFRCIPVGSNGYAKHQVSAQYLPLGSGEGIKQISADSADFGGTDAPMTDEQVANAKRALLHLPTVVGAVVAIYNLPGVTEELRLTPEALAGIYLGKVRKWNDPAIAEPNGNISLPEQDIEVVYRGDPSGTTYVWTDYLSKISSEWRTRVGKGTLVSWPVGHVSGKGSGSMAATVKQTPYSIGYVELTFAKQANLQFATLRNAAGKFVRGDLAGVAAAASTADASESNQFRFSLTNAACDKCYPIASFTWLLVPTENQDMAKRMALKSFLVWALRDGQGFAEGLGYVRLPEHLVKKELSAVARL